MYQIHAIKLIAKKDVMRTLRTPGVYLAFLMSCAGATLSAYFFSVVSNAFSSMGVGLTDIYTSITMLAILGIYALYMAVTSVTTIARERQDKTLEVLFYGPVNQKSFILGKYLGRMAIFILLLLGTTLYITAAGLAFGLGVNETSLKLAILSTLLISCIVSLGILLSTLTSSVTGSIFLLIIFMIAMFLLKVAGIFLGIIPDINPIITIARNMTVTLINVTQYVSPVEYLSIGIDAVNSADLLKYAAGFLYPAAYTGLLLWISTVILKKKGVKQ